MSTKNLSQLLNDVWTIKANTLQLQIAYANFLNFQKENESCNRPSPCSNRVWNFLWVDLVKAYLKMALGDILVFDKKFNEALIYFSRKYRKALKNDVLGQDARFKVAQASFYKGDFDWALTQLKVLRVVQHHN